MYKNHGFTIAELTAAIFLFGLIALLSANIIYHTAVNHAQLSAREEALHEAQISIDFIVAQIRLANAYRIRYRSGDTLLQLDLYTALSGTFEHTYEIRYYEGGRRILFGGNEYASNIDVCTIAIDNGLAYITLVSTVDGQSVEISTACNIKYKERRF